MSGYIGAGEEQASADAILVDFAAEAKKDDPSSPEARALVLRWRDHIARFHGSCDEEKLRRLAFLYGADDRFAERNFRHRMVRAVIFHRFFAFTDGLLAAFRTIFLK